MFAPKSILVPTDFSEFSDNALQTAKDIAKQYNAKIYLLHVISTVRPCGVDYCIDEQTIDTLEKKGIEFSQDMMQKQIVKVVHPENVEIEPYVASGQAHEEILKQQRSRNIDLIVIASHGKTGILAHLLGSVAEKVVRGATCPVVLLKKK